MHTTLPLLHATKPQSAHPQHIRTHLPPTMTAARRAARLLTQHTHSHPLNMAHDPTAAHTIRPYPQT